MFLSPEELAARARDGVPVAIIGSGPAGLSLAMRLAELGVQSLLVEAGTREPVSDTDTYRGGFGDRPYPLGASRMFGLGGTSGHWGGWCRPLDPVDFEPIEGVPLTGWPIGRDEAYAELARAHAILEIPDARYDAPEVLAEAARTAITPPGDEFTTAVFRFSPPTRFGVRYRAVVRESPHIHCAVRTSLAAIDRVDGRTRLQLRDANGARVDVVAGASVLAMGGIENARLLMWSERLHRLGLPGADWIGRCFVDHFGITPAQFMLPGALDYGRRETPLGALMPQLVPSAARVRRGEVPNHMLGFSTFTDDGLIQPEYGESAALFGAGAAPRHAHAAVLVSGQRPNRDSRILLDDALDAHGLPRVKVDWRIADADFAGVLASLERLGRLVAASGLGRMRQLAVHVPTPTQALSAGMHHIGTTRMARDAREGVVDTDGRVFGTDDLYVAGSSVFPTSGYANPTLTLVALALRLAGHLAARAGVR